MKKQREVERRERPVDPELVQSLEKAANEGDLIQCQSLLVRLRNLRDVKPESLEEVQGHAFVCAVRRNHIEIMDLVLTTAPSLRHGLCKTETYFPREVCLSTRYLGFAAMTCVQNNSLRALEYLVERRLLVDTELLNCFRRATQLAADFSSSTPGAYRPMLMLLLYEYPLLLCSSLRCTQGQDLPLEEQDLNALRSSLLYEYNVNTTAIESQARNNVKRDANI